MKDSVNFKSDFTLILHLFACDLEGGGEKIEIDFPDYDWKAIFYTTQKANAYTASCVGGECVNCVNDGGRIRVVFNDHRLSPGVLRVEFTAYLPDGGYPDGDERVVTPGPLGVILVREAAPCPSLVEAELMLPYVKFQYEDLTDEQKAELMQPAVDAANHAEAVLKDAEAATAQAVESNHRLAADIEAAAEAERLRQQAEETRISNEELRQRAETLREDAEAQREKAETTRKESESARVTSEKARVSAESERAKAETARVTAENARESAESKRVGQEISRKEAEGLRISEESKRVEAEAKRVTAENTRKTAEQGRVTAESGRVSAEAARVLAEQKRATEFDGWQSEIDAKPDRSELSNVLAELAAAPELAFRELWRSAGCSVDEAADPPEMYRCNGLGMSYAEARAVYAAGVMTNNDINARYAGMSIRTHLPSQIRWGASAPAPITFRGSSVEVVAAPLLTPGTGCFRDCTKLRKASVFSPRGTNARSDAWAGCKALETLTVAAMVPGSFSLADSPLISLASLRGIISKAWEGMGATTITLHPDTYAKMTDTDPDADPLWLELPVLAAEKNITFTTTE